jgi:hypothetical protein
MVTLLRYDAIRTLALTPRTKSAPIERVLTTTFPGDLRARLAQLKRKRPPRSEVVYLPIHSLNAALAALMPQVISIEKGVARPEYIGPWLHVSVEPAAEVIPTIMASWIRAEFEGDDAYALAASIMRKKFLWTRTDIRVADWQAGPNGTAVPGADNQFPFLAHFLAAQLSSPKASFTYGGSAMSWRRAPAALGETNVADLVSWPAFELTSRHHRWLFSIGLSLRVETIPWVAQPYVFAALSMRRWMTQPVATAGERAVHVLLSPNVPWIGDTRNRREFQRARIGRRWDSASKRSEWRWLDGLAPVLNDFGEALQQALPQPEALLSKPSDFLPGVSDPAALVIFREGMRPGHPAGPGWGPKERKELFERLAGLLERWMEPAQSLTRAPISSSPRRQSSADLAASAWSVVERAPNRLELVILEQSSETTRAVRAAGRELFKPSGESDLGSGWVWHRADQQILVNAIPFGSVAGALDPSPGRDAYLDQVRRRSQDVKAWLAGSDQPRACLVELGNRQEFPDRSDPKFAIRRGAALAGYLTQFLTPTDRAGSASPERRARSALLDLLRQLGLPGLSPPNPGFDQLGLWVIRQTARTGYDRRGLEVPVAVRLRSETTCPELRAPGFEGWLPYHSGLLELVKQADPFAGTGMKADECQGYFGAWIEEAAVGGRPTMILASAQNVRHHWPAVNNKNVQADILSCGSRVWNRDRGQNLRFVRIRTSEDGETPEWHGEPHGGLPAGVWSLPGSDRVFYSAHHRPVTAKFNLALSKITQWSSKTGVRHPRPTARTPNPQLVEMTAVLTQAGDDWANLAGIAHAYRQAAAHFNDPLILPLSLHLAQLVREYVLADSGDGSHDAEAG